MRAVAAGAAFLIISVGIAGCSGIAKPAHEQPAPLPGRFAALWSDPTNSELFAASSASGQVVFTNAAGNLTIDSAQTGHPRHTITTSQPWKFNEIDVIGTRLYTESNEDTSKGGDQIKVAVYNLATGTQIWQDVLNAGPDASGSDVLFTENGIVVQPGGYQGTGAIEGLNVTNGQQTWHSTPGLCQIGTQLASSDTAAYAIQCAGRNQTALEAIQPATGHVSWRHTFDTPDVSQDGPIGMYLAENGGVLAQLGNGSIHVYAPDGHPITTLTGTQSCPTGWCVYQAEGNRGVLELGPSTDQTDPAQELVQGISLPSGHVRWQRKGELFYPAVQTNVPVIEDNGIDYGQAGKSVVHTAGGFGLEPMFVTVLQAETGRSVTLPLPLADTPEAPSLAGAAGGLLYVMSGNPGIVTAFRPEPATSTATKPAILAGVNPATWPDACTLLTPADLSHVIAPGYTAVPAQTLTLAGVTWPKPVGCTFIGPATDDPVVAITIAWIASSTQQASELLSTWLAANTPGSTPIPGGYIVNDGTIDGSDDRALITAGRAIVEVTVPDHAADARALAPVIASELRVAYG